MVKILKFKIIILIISMTLIINYSVVYASKIEINKVKIYFHNKDVTKKLYPAVGNGVLYVVEKNLMQVIKSDYETVDPIFIKKGDSWRQLASSYFRIFSEIFPVPMFIRFYPNDSKVRIFDTVDIKEYQLSSPISICKKKTGDITFISEERRINPDPKGPSFLEDDIVAIKKGEYNIYYVPLEEVCKILGWNINKKNNLYEIKLMQ